MNEDRNAARNVFFESWRKHNAKEVLEPLEAQIVDLILLHPEYHDVFSNPDNFQEADFDSANPFLHLSLHLAVREQISINRPVGMTAVFQALCVKLQNPHDAEHRILECLGRVLWEAQQSGKPADEEAYLEMLRKI
jgi:hypothetical protein